MGYDLAPIRKRLEWAEHHLETLERNVTDTLRVGGYGVRRELEAEGAEHVYYAVVREGLREDLNFLASDCLHHFRSCLDNLVYRLAELNLARVNKAIPPDVEGELAFPICLYPHHFKSVRKSRLACLSRDAAKLIRANQPYVRWNPPEVSPLWALHELQNIDKHRFVTRLAFELSHTSYSGPLGVRIVPRYNPLFLHDPESVKDGDELARLCCDPPQPDADLEFEPHLLVVFDEGTPSAGRDLTGELRSFRMTVEQIVYDAEQLI
jgi:hypothetical protein